MRKEIIRIEQVSASLLKEATYNPRRMTEKQENDLTESIKRYGLVDPIIVNRHKDRLNIVIGGHGRLKIAKKLGYKEVPVVYLSLNEEKEKELNLRLNKNTGEWDLDLLKEFDIDLLLDVGFDDNDLASIWDENLETEDDDFNVEKELEETKKTDIKLGDLFVLGNNVLLCGDSLQEESVKLLMGNEKADMVYNDIFYNIGLDYDKGIGGKNKKYGGNVNDKRSDEEYRDILKKTISNSLSACKKDAHIFHYSDPYYIGMVQELYKELGIKNKRVCLWVKGSCYPTPQIAFGRSYEPCTYGTVGDPYLAPINNLGEILNKEVENGNRAIDDISDLMDIWLVKRLPGQEYEHPTQKPVTLHEKPLRRCTKVNDIVLDMFAGSGSTLISCAQLKRRCYTIEINPIFCQLVINRFEKLTGTKAKLITNAKNIWKK